MLYVPHGTIKLNANFNLESFPYDTQKINITVSSWYLSDDFLHIVPYDMEDVDNSITKSPNMYEENIQWDLTNMSVSYRTETLWGDDYSMVTFTLDIKRMGSTMTVTVISQASL